ncbi:MAG: hypothetical protein RDV48_06585 [Candidatus Eremiobacteraeota bacterium]|nr:hypothetical protein [Candidatus Eremiobacteraeota bacterium]
MSFLEDLHKARRVKESEQMGLEQHQKIVRIRREQKYKEIQPMVNEMLDSLGMATWGCTDGDRNYEVFADIAHFQWKLYSGPYEYILRIIFDDEGYDYYEVGSMGNMARTQDLSRKSLEHMLKTIYKRGPDYLGEANDPAFRKKKKK